MSGGSTFRWVYVNGDYIGGGLTGSVFSNQTSGGLRIGSLLSGGSYLDGNVAAFAIFPAALPDPSTLYRTSSSGSQLSVYSYLDAASARWSSLGTGSTTFTLSSSGLNTGSKLNVSYRDARL